jgi:hypothetical protein
MADLDKMDQARRHAYPFSQAPQRHSRIKLDVAAREFQHTMRDIGIYHHRAREPLRLSHNGARWYKRMCSIPQKIRTFCGNANRPNESRSKGNET